MPIELSVICASDFVCLDADEHVNFEESKKVLQGLAAACQKRGLDRAMVDLRDLPVADKPQFTNAELAALVGAFRAAGFTRRQRLAILYRQDVYGDVRHFTFFSRVSGLQVQAFNDFETAIHWLWRETVTPEHKHEAEVPILPAKKRAAGRIYRTARPVPVRRLRGNHS